jgi:hypothetical protein
VQMYLWDKHHKHRLKKMLEIDSMTCLSRNSTIDMSLNCLLGILLISCNG